MTRKEMILELVYNDIYSGERDEFIKRVLRQGFTGYENWDDAALDHLIRSRADTVYHPVGSARMGSDDQAVCDPHLRVRGVEGLYIADASVMPRLVSGNTNAPSIMIGERCADFVKADLG